LLKGCKRAAQSRADNHDLDLRPAQPKVSVTMGPSLPPRADASNWTLTLFRCAYEATHRSCGPIKLVPRGAALNASTPISGKTKAKRDRACGSSRYLARSRSTDAAWCGNCHRLACGFQADARDGEQAARPVHWRAHDQAKMIAKGDTVNPSSALCRVEDACARKRTEQSGAVESQLADRLRHEIVAHAELVLMRAAIASATSRPTPIDIF
jgi:hypothetical protein